MKPRLTNTKAELLMAVGDGLFRAGNQEGAERWWQRAVDLRVRHARRRRAARRER